MYENNDYNNFGGYNVDAQRQQQSTLSVYASRVMRRVYLKMTLALVVTAFTALFCVSTPSVIMAIVTNRILFWGLIIGELALVLFLSARIDRMSESMSTLLFYVYAIVNGAVLSIIFLVYTMSSIALTFFITAGVFGAMSIYGYFTNRDLTKIGSFLFMALIGLIICTVVNIFLKSTAMDWLISFVGVAIFIGLTAWDTQKIKQWAAMSDGNSAGKVATMGALSLYLDFINIFLYLLRFFGRSN
ncbi:MAG: Bax inhibitor-1/YccA family protein [Muribaculaceae bacterium]|jgi:FtsH-binding integral membrane protein|nr:Bax inhibitor-1/YccA family protein [Muribaculaceae bacterium]